MKHTINLKLLAVSDVRDEREEGMEGMYTTDLFTKGERGLFFN